MFEVYFVAEFAGIDGLIGLANKILACCCVFSSEVELLLKPSRQTEVRPKFHSAMTLSTTPGTFTHMLETLGSLTVQGTSKTRNFHIPKAVHISTMSRKKSRIFVAIMSRKVVCRDSTNDATNHFRNSKRSRWKEDECVRIISSTASDLSTLSSYDKCNVTNSMVAINSPIDDITTLRLTPGDTPSCDHTKVQAPPRKRLQVAVDVDEGMS